MVQYITYNALMIRNMHFETGDIAEFNAILGQIGASVDSTGYRVINKWSIEKIK